MATRSWSSDRARQRIEAKIAALPLFDIEIKKYVRDADLGNIANNVAFRVDGVHLYVDILNLGEMLNVTAVEGERCHRHTLRFLNLHYRAVGRILDQVDALFVDFHNQRLHAVVAKPYDSERQRLHRAIAIAQLIIDVLARTGEGAEHPAAIVRVGIDSGKALAVNNGRRGHREPLFLGQPANHAAKRSGGGTAPGIYLTNHAREVLGLGSVTHENSAPLSGAEIATSQLQAFLPVSPNEIIEGCKNDLAVNPIGTFEFAGHTPPFRDLDFESLSVRNSRRQPAAAIYADIDGFTSFVAANIHTELGAKAVVRALHVLRSELDAVLHEDFSGRKVRFIGDCIHGLLGEGTAQTTDTEKTISTMLLCAAAMRSSFELAVQRLGAEGVLVGTLGLQIGFEFGPITATRLGIKSELVRCSVSRAVLTAEKEQSGCRGNETAIGPVAFSEASVAVRGIFAQSRRRAGLNYPSVVAELSRGSDRVAKAAVAAESAVLLQRAAAATATSGFPNQRITPAKPAGFA